MSDVLNRIKAYKLDEIAARKAARSLAEVEAAAKAAPPVRGFHESLKTAAQTGFGLIAEIKKASPSRGLIRADFSPPDLAVAYENGGAACLSVLTDGPSFQGDDIYLTTARGAVALPVLRKDFLYDPYQVAESRSLGADCILIILASVSDAQACELESAANDWGMDALLEVHNAPELDRALNLKSPMIGINNRDLRSFDVTLETTRQLSRRVPADRMIVSESGIFTIDDLNDLARFGARAFLVGESLMRQNDVERATAQLLGTDVSTQG